MTSGKRVMCMIGECAIRLYFHTRQCYDVVYQVVGSNQQQMKCHAASQPKHVLSLLECRDEGPRIR